jgi:hypothetical protein
MTGHQDLKTLEATGQAFPAGGSIHPKKTRDELIESAIQALEKVGAQLFETLPGVEGMSLRTLRSMPTRNTILHPIVEALAREDVPVRPMVGGVMDALHLDRHQLHRLSCRCYEGDAMFGSNAARRLREIAAEEPRQPLMGRVEFGILVVVVLALAVSMAIV